MYTKDDVGARYRNGKPVELSDQEKQAIVDEWNTPPDIEAVRDAKLSEIRAAADAVVAPLKAPYSKVEQDLWLEQEEDAKAFLADPEADTPTLDKFANKRGLERSEMADKIMTAATLFRETAREAASTQQALEDTVKAATTVAEIEAVEWPE